MPGALLSLLPAGGEMAVVWPTAGTAPCLGQAGLGTGVPPVAPTFLCTVIGLRLSLTGSAQEPQPIQVWLVLF